MKFLLSVIVLIVLVASTSFAQTGKRQDKKPTRNTTSSVSSGSGNERSNTIFTENKRSGSKRLSWADQKKKEYEERMEANAKKYKKMAKEMEKPQYSDPSYFGHKKKPKKHRPGKKKLCKECGMRH